MSQLFIGLSETKADKRRFESGRVLLCAQGTEPPSPDSEFGVAKHRQETVQLRPDQDPGASQASFGGWISELLLVS